MRPESGRCGRRAGVIDDAQLGRRLPVPFLLGVLARDALARRRVLEEALPVVDDLADIELVVEDAVAALGQAEQSGGVPMPARRSRHAFAIEIAHDRQRPFAGGVLAEDAPHDIGLSRIDGAAPALLTILDHVVPVALAAGNSSGPERIILRRVGLNPSLTPI